MTHTYTHTRWRTHTLTQDDTHIHPHKMTHTYTHTRWHTHTPTQDDAHIHPHKRTHTYTHTRWHTHTLTQDDTHMHPHKMMHTYTHTRWCTHTYVYIGHWWICYLTSVKSQLTWNMSISKVQKPSLIALDYSWHVNEISQPTAAVATRQFTPITQQLHAIKQSKGS